MKGFGSVYGLSHFIFKWGFRENVSQFRQISKELKDGYDLFVHCRPGGIVRAAGCYDLPAGGLERDAVAGCR